MSESAAVAPPVVEKRSLGAQNLRASLWLSAANAAKLGLQLAIIPVLARLLGPSAYGLVSLAMPFILLTNLLSDAGLGAGLARRGEASEALESTVFWLSCALGASLSLVVAALAWPAAVLVRQPAIAPVLLALSPILLIGGFISTPNARVVRQRRFSVFAVGDFVSTVLATGAAVAAALNGWGAWSLVAQQLVLWSFKAVWTFAASGLRVRAIFRPVLARELVGFGLRTVGANVCEFVSKNIDNLLIGLILGVTALGAYAMAYQIISIPGLIISGPLYLTIFTSVARAGADRTASAQIVASSLRLLALCITPIFTGLALTADLAVSVVLGARWTAAGPAIALLAPAGLLICLYTFVSATLMGRGRADLQLRLALLNGAAIAAAVLIGALYGMLGVACGVSLALLVIAPAYLGALAKESGASLAEVGRAFRAPILGALVMAAAVTAVRWSSLSLAEPVRFGLAILSGAAAYGATVTGLERRRMGAMVAQLRHRARGSAL